MASKYVTYRVRISKEAPLLLGEQKVAVILKDVIEGAFSRVMPANIVAHVNIESKDMHRLAAERRRKVEDAMH